MFGWKAATLIFFHMHSTVRALFRKLYTDEDVCVWEVFETLSAGVFRLRGCFRVLMGWRGVDA